MPDSDPPVEGEIVTFADLFVANGQLTPIGGFTSDPEPTNSDSTSPDSSAAAGGGAPGAGRLPETGSMSTTIAVLATVLLASGGAMVLSRRRTHAS